MSLKGPIISEKDLTIMRFLWRWKVATTAAIHLHFFPETKKTAAYQRLNKLKKGGYICINCNEWGGTAVWTLTQKGFRAIRIFLYPLREEGFKSEYTKHDLFCMAVHLGDLKKQPKEVQLISEQQLRRIEVEEFPQYIPNPETHCPDGYWVINKEDKRRVIALEVELSRKSLKQLANPCYFYDTYSEIDHVLWIISEPSLKNQIKRSAAQYHQRKEDIHYFCHLKDFQQFGWDAPTYFQNKKNKTIREFLGFHLDNTQRFTHNQGDATKLLDGRLRR